MKDAKGGAIEFRTEKTGIIHAGIGKASLHRRRLLLANVKALVDALNKAKPSGSQGHLHQEDQPLLDDGPGLQGLDTASAGSLKRSADVLW